MKENKRGLLLFISLALVFLIILFIIVIFIIQVLQAFARSAETTTPSIISIANQIDDVLQNLRVLGPDLSSIISTYVDTICVPRQAACPPATDIALPNFTYENCPVLCGPILASKTICENLPNNTFCNNVIDNI